MRAAALTRPGTIVLEDRPEPRPDPDEVLVRVRAVGVCGSDVHYFEHGRIGSYVLEQPLVLGHEAAGVVEAVSRNVPPGRVGERVSIKPGRPDFTCPRCVADRNNLRERMSYGHRRVGSDASGRRSADRKMDGDHAGFDCLSSATGRLAMQRVGFRRLLRG